MHRQVQVKWMSREVRFNLGQIQSFFGRDFKNQTSSQNNTSCYNPHQSLIRPFCHITAILTTFRPWWLIIDSPIISRNTLRCNKICECSWFDQIHWFLIYNTSAQYQFVILWQVLQMGLSNINWSFWSFLDIWTILDQIFWLMCVAIWTQPSTRFWVRQNVAIWQN